MEATAVAAAARGEDVAGEVEDGARREVEDRAAEGAAGQEATPVETTEEAATPVVKEVDLEAGTTVEDGTEDEMSEPVETGALELRITARAMVRRAEAEDIGSGPPPPTTEAGTEAGGEAEAATESQETLKRKFQDQESLSIVSPCFF
jgi:hypothetical protein